MFSSTSRFFIRARCVHCFSSISSATQEPQLLKHISNSFKCLTASSRFINTDKFNPLEGINPEDTVKKAAEKQRRKTPEVPKITLLDTNNSMTVCTLEQAEKVAEGRKLRLVNVVDMDLRSQRPVYKLMTEAQYLEEEIKEKKAKKSKGGDALKGEKIMVLSTRIMEDDLEMKIRKAVKWVEKNYEVRITICGTKDVKEAELESIFKKFEERLDGKARILQKRIKENDLKFQAMPLREQLIASSLEKRDKKNKKSKYTAEGARGEKEDFNEVTKEKKNDSDTEVTSKENILSKV